MKFVKPVTEKYFEIAYFLCKLNKREIMKKVFRTYGGVMKRNVLLVLLAMISFVYSAGITIGPNARVSFGNVNVNVYGNLKNTLVKDGVDEKLGQITVLPTSKVSFVGSSQDTVTNIYTFPNVVINKPSGNVLIANNTNSFVLTNNITFTKGSVLTGTSTFELGTTATVSGESTNGYIVGTAKAARVVGTGSSTFGGIGYSMGTGTGNLGTVTVYRYTGDGSEEVLYGSEGIWRKWDVQTSNAFSGTRQVTTSWLSNEDNGNVLANLKVWKYETAKGVKEDIDQPDDRRIALSAKNLKSGISYDRDILESISENEEDLPVPEETPKTLGWVEVDGAVFNTASSPRTATYTISAATQYTINDVANAFADGSGTESNPYQIATLDQLNAVRYYPSAHFIQIADIDAAATTGWNSGAGWDPIDNFAGKYNGDGHTVSNLYINRTGTIYIGLFGITNTGSEIKDMGLENISAVGGDYSAGFVGYSRGTVKNCYAQGSVSSSTGYRSGGFVGYAYSGSDIHDCYADVEVTRLTGGTETINIGGFCGRLYLSPITNCYSLGGVHFEGTTDPTNKGFLGAISSGTMSGDFWNTETSGQTSTAGAATGLTNDGMRVLSTFTNATWDFQDESANGVEDIWGINATEHSGFPFLSWEGLTHNPSPFAGGIGTSDEPFLVSNLTQLDAVRNFKSYHFLQTADIDAGETLTWNSGAGWTPIGSGTADTFGGSYDGSGHKISHLFINNPTIDYIGLFGCSYNGSVIKNIGIENADITGDTYVSGLLGRNYGGDVENCFVTGSINGISYTGGLVGYIASPGTITNCYSKATITRISGTSTGVGAFCGRNFNGTITKSFSTGSVHYNDYTDPTDKGFLGSVGTVTMTDNFWDMETSGQLTSVGGVTGKTTAEMQNIATYTSLVSTGLTNPWDFVGDPNDDAGVEDIWNIHASINSGYPYLNWEYRLPVEAPANLVLTISGTDVIITWDAVTDANGYLVYSSADPYGTFTLDETGVFNGTEWTGPLTGTKMFYYVAAVNDTKVITARKISSGNISR